MNRFTTMPGPFECDAGILPVNFSTCDVEKMHERVDPAGHHRQALAQPRVVGMTSPPLSCQNVNIRGGRRPRDAAEILDPLDESRFIIGLNRKQSERSSAERLRGYDRFTGRARLGPSRFFEDHALVIATQARGADRCAAGPFRTVPQPELRAAWRWQDLLGETERCLGDRRQPGRGACVSKVTLDR